MSLSFTTEEKDLLQLFDPMVLMAFLTSLNELRTSSGTLTMEDVQRTHDDYFITHRKLDVKTLEKIYNEIKTNPRTVSLDPTNPTFNYDDEIIKATGSKAEPSDGMLEDSMPLPGMDELMREPDIQASEHDVAGQLDDDGTTIDEPAAIKLENVDAPSTEDNSKEFEDIDVPKPIEEGEMPL
ncbi:hypothetical protein CL634_07935 [bacterium]|nr:hypothetical protein [bacterium]|tara:strand:+ start:203 stop:748 length:546 start_codon:yes stop_codon:yes gene_type:complete